MSFPTTAISKWTHHRPLPYFLGSLKDKVVKGGLNVSNVSLWAAKEQMELLEIRMYITTSNMY